eukprot:TRINITY_DN34414_c0_g1_i9.p1 TRINITY_DN34414_c0_g1~~TRINITY_DN34414_c0_g1_i9.p1  ORF type:complete len:253 (-),score=52.80 TRINITY_DN34414_c0_g1_i9:375-1133(-)
MMFFQRKWCRLCATLRTGKQQYDSYRESVLVQGTTSIHDPIKRNSFRLFRCPTQKYRRSDKSRELKEDVSLFSHLYIAAQSRESDLGNFFKHENHPYPPSLSDRGALRTGTKSDLLPCLVKAKQTDVLVATEALSTTDSAECDDDVESSDLRDFDIEKTDNIEVGEVPPDVLMSLSDASAIQPDCADKLEPPSMFDVTVLDGMAVLHFLDPRGSTTFEDFANSVFLPYVSQQLEHTRRLDIVWDSYLENSLK